MKLTTLITTLIITLTSSNAFAQTFVCENWEMRKNEEEIKGSLFVGEMNDDTITIKNDVGEKLTYNFLGKSFIGKYYTYNDKGLIKIIEFVEGKMGGLTDKEAVYDILIVEVYSHLGGAFTYCNWQ